MRLFNVRREAHQTVVRPFENTDPVLADSEILKELSDRGEEGLFESLVLRGLIDE